MNHPGSDADRLIIEKWTQDQKGNTGFDTFMRWIEDERSARDRENRIPGSENRTSEAEALTTILEVTMFGAEGERIKKMREASSR